MSVWVGCSTITIERQRDRVRSSIWTERANTIHIDSISDDIKPVVRVGIAMGEVVIADETVTGEAVVLAQRLEQLAEPGLSVFTALPKILFRSVCPTSTKTSISGS